MIFQVGFNIKKEIGEGTWTKQYGALGDTACVILEKRLPEEQVNVWVASSKGYNLLKYTYHRSKNSARGGKRLSEGGVEAFDTEVSLQVGQICDLYVVVSGTLTHTIR